MDQNEFDIAAEKAAKELEELVKKLDEKTIREMASWWKRNYMKAGHKRLGRIIAKFGQEESTERALPETVGFLFEVWYRAKRSVVFHKDALGDSWRESQ